MTRVLWVTNIDIIHCQVSEQTPSHSFPLLVKEAWSLVSKFAYSSLFGVWPCKLTEKRTSPFIFETNRNVKSTSFLVLIFSTSWMKCIFNRFHSFFDVWIASSVWWREKETGFTINFSNLTVLLSQLNIYMVFLCQCMHAYMCSCINHHVTIFSLQFAKVQVLFVGAEHK